MYYPIALFFRVLFLFLFSIFIFVFCFFDLLLASFGAVLEPFGAQKRREELKSVWTDPFSARMEALEPSFGRFGRKWVEKGRVWSLKMESEARFGRWV